MPDHDAGHDGPLHSFPKPPLPPFKGKFKLFWIAAGALVAAAIILIVVSHFT